MKKLFFLLCAVAAFSAVSAQSLPDVKIENVDGEIVSTASLAGRKPLIIAYWSIACKPCIQELNAINDQLEDWRKEADFDVVAVFVLQAANQRFIEFLHLLLGILHGNVVFILEIFPIFCGRQFFKLIDFSVVNNADIIVQRFFGAAAAEADHQYNDQY